MIDRNKVVVAVMAVLAVVAAVGFGLMVVRLGGGDCIHSAAGASCPVLAEVDGVRYSVGVANEYIDLQQDLVLHSSIARTNAPDQFAELVTFRIASLDPTAVLAAPARPVLAGDVGPYRLLFGPNSERAWPALCDYIPIEVRFGDGRCGGPA
jgi:hypothetical protein